MITRTPAAVSLPRGSIRSDYEVQLPRRARLEADTGIRRPGQQALDARMHDAGSHDGPGELALARLVEVVEGSPPACTVVRDHPDDDRVLATRQRAEGGVRLRPQVDEQAL